MGLNAALGIASRALGVFSTGIQVAGQNIANATTPGYIREHLQLAPSPSYGAGELVLGTGVTAVGVTQQIDKFLQVRIQSANSDSSASDARDSIYTQLQTQLKALGDGDVSAKISSFLGAINDSANQPESVPLRQQVVGQGGQLADAITSLRSQLDQQRHDENVKVDELVERASQLIKQIADLNPQISKLEAAGLLKSQAGSLRDQRYLALDELSNIIPITYQERGDGSVDVFSGSDFLILAGKYQQLQTVATGDRGVAVENVELSITHSEINAASPGGGELRGLLQGRDNVVAGFVDQLDALTSNLIFEFNKIHSSGEGLQGLTSVTSENAVSDATAALDSAGLTFSPSSGSFQIKITDKLTGQSKTSTINVDLHGLGTDTTLTSLAGDLNAVAGISATVSADGHLRIDADPNTEIRFSHDSSSVLASFGINTFFSGSDSGSIGVNPTVADNPSLFAASLGGGSADGTNALAMAEFSAKPLDGLNGMSIDGYYDSAVTDVANKAAGESTMSKSLKDFRDSLVSQQQQFSGVSLDEEAISLMQYQQSYQAAAKVVTTIDELFQALLKI